MEKLQFEFTIVASTKEKTNTIIITSINTEEEKRHVLPAEFRHIYRLSQEINENRKL